MKRLVFLSTGLLFSIQCNSQANSVIETPENPYSLSFQKAYSIYPSVPKGFLEAIAYTQTRFYHLDGTQNSCVGLPKALTVMGLIEDGKNYFRENLITVSQLSGFSIEDIKNHPETSILAYAAAFQKLQQQKNIFGTDRLERYKDIFMALSELPLPSDIINDFAMQSHLYQIYWFLSKKEFQQAYHFPEYHINLKEIFSENYVVLSAGRVTVSEESIYTEDGAMYKYSSVQQVLSPDYPPAIWDPAASCNYSSRGGVQVSAVTIHVVQGSYAGCISWFKNCSAQVSAHYVLRSSDGQVTQMVLEANKAWHVGTENPYTIGLEHEGYISSSSWFTTAMYNSSAALVKDICNSGYGISPLRTGFWPWLPTTHYNTSGIPGSCTKIKGHQHYPNQTHTDPNQYWDWNRYYKLINQPYTITATYTTSSGNFYDSGGAGGNYSNDERKLYLFTQPGATNIQLNFTSFSLENTWDYMYIYNGGSVWSPQVGVYTGTNSPGVVSVNNDSVLVEFRSDCATTSSGWAATFTITATGSATDNVAPTTAVSVPSGWVTGNFTTTITDADNTGGSGIQKGYYQVIDYNGTEWRANAINRGFFSDNFDDGTIHSDWSIVVGTWNESGGYLNQTDETSSTAGNTNIYAAVTQTLSNRYLYEFDILLDGSGTNRRGGFHFFCDTGNTTNRSNSYFVWFRLDNQKFQLYKVVNNSFGSPVVDIPLPFSANTWYNVKVIYDRITGEIWTYWNNQLINKWQDPSPHNPNNGRYVSFRSGNAVMKINQLKIYRSRSAGNIPVLVGAGSGNDIRYQNPNPSQPAGRIKSISQDNADNISAIVWQDVNVDWTPPSNPSPVNDGKTTDINVVCTKDSISANWATSTDPHSGLTQYWYSIGTAPGSTNVIGWTNAWANTLVTVNIPGITHGTTYYFNIKAENGAGLFSSVISSDGQMVDTTCFTTGVSELFANINGNNVILFPNPVKEKLQIIAPSIFDVQIHDAIGNLILSKKSNEKMMNINTNNWASGVYFIHIITTDGKIQTGKIFKE